MEKLDHSTNIFVMEKIVPSGESQILDNLTFIELYNLLYAQKFHSRGAEAWSTTKNFAAANAARKLREDLRPYEEFGLDSSVFGKHGQTEFGDLVTVINSYDITLNYRIVTSFYNLSNLNDPLSMKFTQSLLSLFSDSIWFKF